MPPLVSVSHPAVTFMRMKPRELVSRLIKRVPEPPKPPEPTHYQVHGGFAAPQARPSSAGHVDNLSPDEEAAALREGANVLMQLAAQQDERHHGPVQDIHILP